MALLTCLMSRTCMFYLRASATTSRVIGFLGENGETVKGRRVSRAEGLKTMVRLDLKLRRSYFLVSRLEGHSVFDVDQGVR